MMICRSDAVKGAVSMYEIAVFYGYIPNQSGFICCPFHEEHTPSLKIYKEIGRGYHCFGCGAGGSVIDFVMSLFDLEFQQALLRIDYDFHLGLSEEKPSHQQVEKYRKEREKEQNKLKDFRKEYMEKVYLHRELHFARQNPSHPRFQESLQKLDYLDYWFEENPWR